MISFVYRLVSLLVRVGCPISILYISTPALLGEYYLFSTFITFAIFFISLEMAVPFSIYYLKVSKESSRRKVFSAFMNSQVLISALTSIPLFCYFAITNSLAPMQALFFYLALVVSACSNETGRFFWNIGKGIVATRRDVFRSLIFVIAILLSVEFYQSVISTLSLGLIIFSELLLLRYEVSYWGRGKMSRFFLKSTNYRRRRWVLGFLNQLKLSSPQVLHLQILAAFPFLERLIIDRGLGLAAVGAFSFQYAGVQAGLSLLLMPMVARVRQSILAAQTSNQYRGAHRMALILLLQISVVSVFFSVASWFAVPLLAELMQKNLELQPLGAFAVMLSAIASTFNSAVSPLYAKEGRILNANLITLFCMLPMAIIVVAITDIHQEISMYVFSSIAAASLLQISVRVGHHIYSLNNSA